MALSYSSLCLQNLLMHTCSVLLYVQGGMVGVAPGSSLYSINVFGPVTATTSDILAGLDWVQRFNANVTTTTGRGKIRVINMSFGDYSDAYKSTDGISMANNPSYPNCGAGNPRVDPWHTGQAWQ
jgi:hypothetical protein